MLCLADTHVYLELVIAWFAPVSSVQLLIGIKGDFYDNNTAREPYAPDKA